MVDLPAVAVGKIERDGVADGVAGADGHAFQVDAAVVKIGIDQVRIDRELLDVLPERFQRPIVLLFDFPNPDADLIGVTLVALVRMPGPDRAIVAVEVHRKISEEADR